MNKTLLYIISFLLFLSLPILAQESNANKREQLLQASKEYQVGHIDKAIDMLTPYVSSYSGTMKVSAYKLLTLCYLAQDDAENANRYADLLLKEDPYYSISLQDPERFAELIRNKRDGKTTLVTASQQAETLEEAPVPIVLITEDMIKAIGARDLRDVLTAYVPGITSIEGDQANISMHGIYSPTQEKILIMLNGHRMNSRITNAEAPDFRNSLDKIKRIEVLRGPASSLYGNVALTAVVNIITKSGSDINGAYASYGMGSNSTFRGDILFGRRNLDTDILVWGSIYSSKGETRHILSTDDDFWGIIPFNGSIQIDGFNHKPAYDFGVIFQWNKIKAMFNQQYSKRVPSYAFDVIPTIYSYNKYSTYNGAKPGQGRLSTRGEISYSDSRDNFTWDVSLFIDADECSHYNVIGDTLPSFTFDSPTSIETSNDSLLFHTSGVFEIENWRDLSYGGCIKGSYSYRPGKKAHGNILVGVQLENYKMQEYINLTGGLFNQIKTNDSDNTDNQTLALGSEFNFSIFSQLKHHFNSKLIFNGGLRYDYKHRYDHRILQAFSPRVSFIYSINKIWNMKLGYSHSFVDAPYYYRASDMYLTDNLNPESMDAIQLSATALFKHLHLTYDCNLYYNQLSDIIHKESFLYYNTGKLDLIGIENILSYTGKNLMVTCNMSYQYVLNAEHYSSKNHQIYDVPSFSGNLITAAKIFSLPHEQSFWLRGNLSVYSSQLSPISGIKGIGSFISLPDNREKARAILNIGGSYHWKKLELSVQCYNLLNTHYRQGGSSLIYDIPQQGRSFLAKIAYTIQ